MEDDIRHILEVLYFSLGLHFLEVIALLALAMSRDGKSIAGALPAVNDYVKRNFGYVTKIVNKRLRNMNNTDVIPDAPEWMVQRLAAYLWSELQTCKTDEQVQAIPLAETVWIRQGKWKELTDERGTADQFRAVMGRLEADRIIDRQGEKNIRVFAQPYRSLTSKLRGLLPHKAAESREKVR